MDALDPIDCTRCKRRVPVDEPARPEWIKAFVHAPLQPRPMLGETPVKWLIEGDMDRPGNVTALLCHDCLTLLSSWLYLGEAAPALEDDSGPDLRACCDHPAHNPDACSVPGCDCDGWSPTVAVDVHQAGVR